MVAEDSVARYEFEFCETPRDRSEIHEPIQVLRKAVVPKNMLQDTRAFVYRVDAQDRVVFANAEWFDFARENSAVALKSDFVVGTSLWDFICHSETKHLFKILLQQVRATGKSVTLPYRCDSPDCRRFMELRIARLDYLGVEFQSRILRQEQRARVRLMADEVERTDALLTMCGWCKKVALPDDRWVEVEKAVNVLQLFDAPRLPRISHGICQECVDAFENGLAQLA